MNPRLRDVSESPTVRVADQVRRLEAEGVRVVKLQTGDPDFSTPLPIVEAAHKAMKDGLTHYSASRGLPELRKALCDKLAAWNQIQADPASEILITHGASHGIFITMQTLLRPGDEVLLIEPCYMSYAASIRIAGGVPVTVATDASDGFLLDIERLESYITSRTRMLVLNSPCNPSGIVYSKEQVEALAEFALRHDLYILSDEVYERLIYDGVKNTSFASLPGLKERVVTINSFSKTYAMTGWRVGYLTAAAAITAQMLKVLQFSATNIAPFSQMAALTALTNGAVEEDVSRMVEKYAHRRAVAEEAAAGHSLHVLHPRGAFYFLLDISQFDSDSARFAARLLEQAHVGTVPGTAFGASAEGWLRITFACAEETLLDGLARIEKFAHSRS